MFRDCAWALTVRRKTVRACVLAVGGSILEIINYPIYRKSGSEDSGSRIVEEGGYPAAAPRPRLLSVTSEQTKEMLPVKLSND
jgi:hypothetical protein